MMGAPPVFEKDETPMEAPPPYAPPVNANNFTPNSLPPNYFTANNCGGGRYQQPGPIISHQFPPTFNIYSAGWGGSSFVIGEHKDQPLYAVTCHTGWSGNPDVVLHNGPSREAPPLATANEARWTTTMTVGLPPVLVGDWRATAAEEQVWSSGIGYGRFNFEVEVGDGRAGVTRPRREPFEWRHSSGGEVRALGGRSSGWKLVRLNGPGLAAAGGGPVAGDGNEVVAVAANYTMSMSKSFCFAFVGSGATGVLGERWAVMAVITALGIWDKERKSNHASS